MVYSKKGKKPKGETKIVAWFLPKKSRIKFEEDEDSYSLASNVIEASDFVKYPINKGDTVEVSMKDGEVSFLRKTGSAKASSVKEADTTSDNTSASDVVDVTIYAVSGNKKVAKLILVGKDKPETTWYQISESLQAKDYQEIGLQAGKEVSVKIQDETIVAIKAKVETRKDTESSEAKTSSSKRSSYRDEEATDRRSTLMTAKDIVAALINAKMISPDEVKTTLKEYVNTCTELLK